MDEKYENVNKNNSNLDSWHFSEVPLISIYRLSGPKISGTKVFQLETKETDFGFGGDPDKCPTEKLPCLIKNTCYQVQEEEGEPKAYQTHQELQVVLVSS